MNLVVLTLLLDPAETLECTVWSNTSRTVMLFRPARLCVTVASANLNVGHHPAVFKTTYIYVSVLVLSLVQISPGREVEIPGDAGAVSTGHP